MVNLNFRSALFTLLALGTGIVSVAQSSSAVNVLTGTLPGSPTQYLGSSNAADVIFRTTNVERARILSTGFFGIGSNNPQSQFHLGQRALTTLQSYAATATADANKEGLIFNNYIVNADDYRRYSDIGSLGYQNGVAGGSILRFLTNDENNSNALERLRIDRNGYVGIGTSTPTHKLHVHDGGIFVTGTSPGGGSMVVIGGGTVADPNGEWGIEYEPTALGLNFWRPWPASNSGNFFLFLSNNGNIGMGTSTPAYKLDVCGTIRAKEVRVATGWCDYVFDEGYVLRPLAEVESYIKENKHLPEVPAGSVVESEGLALAEMQALHMKKIEELTLYMIQMQKQNAALQARIEALENK